MIEKVKMTYRIEEKEYRLLDPDHFYEYLQGVDTKVSIQEPLKEYLKSNPDKLEGATM